MVRIPSPSPSPEADDAAVPLDDDTLEDELLERPVEADEADVLEQHQEVADDGEDEAPRPGTD